MERAKVGGPFVSAHRRVQEACRRKFSSNLDVYASTLVDLDGFGEGTPNGRFLGETGAASRLFAEVAESALIERRR